MENGSAEGQRRGQGGTRAPPLPFAKRRSSRLHIRAKLMGSAFLEHAALSDLTPETPLWVPSVDPSAVRYYDFRF